MNILSVVGASLGVRQMNRSDKALSTILNLHLSLLLLLLTTTQFLAIMSAERKDLLLRTEAAPQEPIILDVKTTLARLDRASIKLESADHPDAKRKNSTQSSDGEYQVEDIEDRIKDICAGFDTSYDSAAKENPRCSAYAPAFAKVEQTYRDLIGEAVNLFETSEWKDSETKRLVNKLLTLKEPKYAPAKRIVLVGDSGTGRFSLFSSVHDQY